MTTPGFEHHDHASCISGSLEAVEKQCKDKGLRLTPVRKRVLEILLDEHRAMGAYDILDRLRAEGLGSQPPIAYRALDFLVKHRFVHKIERLNAFIACGHPGERHVPAFLICRSCDSVAEAHTDLTQGRLGDVARDAGFVIERTVVEAEGLCPKCQEEAA
ncbi:Fur family transcriptional regulator [Aestuariivita boseongensis]|jgi:Fur family zinc uptake transcriptional regulator|uniref:Fur family transcriptional regulator n=1 Tax=Aestuariivita boseongensis TaxID=1470562 RepID=UPI000681FD99|nr:Fur family transcriptional regulator [Aestuariivita boseongensis]